MVPEPGDAACTVPVLKTFHEQTDDELTEAEIKQMEADDQEIQTILLSLPEDIYAAVDKKKAKLFNEWERFNSTDRESIEPYYHRFSKLMNDFKRNRHFLEKIASNLNTIKKEVDELRAERLAKTQDPLALMVNSNNPFNYLVFHPDLPLSSNFIQQPLPNNNYNLQPSFNQNYMQQPMPNPKDITDPTAAMNMALVLMAKAFKLNYSTPTNNNQRISSNPQNRQIAQPGMNLGQDNQMQMNVGNQNGVIVVLGIAKQNRNGNVVAAQAEGHLARNCTIKPRRRDAAFLQTQLLIAQKEEVGIQLQAEEFDLMVATADLDEIEEVNANCILMANLQQASTSGGGTIEQHPVNVEETRVLYDSLYNNLTTGVEKVKSVNHKLRETNADLTTELATYKNQEKCFEISKEKYDKLESSSKQITALNEEIYNLNKKLSKENSTISSLQEEKKRLKSNFKIRKDKLLDKQIQLENKIKELDNILVKMGQSIQTKHMLSLKPDSFYHTKQKMALGYQNTFYLKQPQQKQQSLYNGKVLLEEHDPPTVYDSEETLELAQESRLKMKQLNKEIKPANYTKINHLSGVFVSQTAKSRGELYLSNTFKMANVSKSILIPNEEFLDDTTPNVAQKILNEVKSTIMTLQRVVKQKITLDIHNWSSSVHQEIYKIIKDKIFPIVNQVDARVQNFEIQFLKEAAKFVRDFQSLTNEANESLSKHKALELEIERLLRAVVSQDIMSILLNSYVVDTSNLQTELERVDMTTNTRRPQPRSNTMNDRVPYASKSSRIKNKEVEVEDHPRNLPLSKNKKHMSFECNNIKLSIQNDKSKIVYVICKQCLITANHDVCMLNYVNDMNSRSKKQKENVSNIANQTKHKAQVWKPKNVGFKKRLASPKPSKPKMRLRWSPTGKKFDIKGKLNASSESNGDNECYPNMFVARRLGLFQAYDQESKASHQLRLDGLGYNLFSVGQFCDSDLEVAFRRNTCFVKNLEGVDLLKGNRTTNLYIINIHDMASASLICLMARATSTKSWLWHQRLSHLNFDTINDLARNDLVTGLPKFKYHKEHLCPLCEQGKCKRASHPPKPVPNSKQRLHLLHMDLCGPMRIASINGKRYILVIVDNYSRYTWVAFLRSKDEAPEDIKTFLKKILVLLQAPVIIVRTNNDTKFRNQVLQEYFKSVGISHQSPSVHTPQKNRVVERRNHMLVEAARTLLIFSRAPLFLWAKAIATACYTQNRSIIHHRFDKTPY
ncbi:retrovirus-related pol polyprotein from transposon TNT 1-94 [Tanacetum coccineum]